MAWTDFIPIIGPAVSAIGTVIGAADTNSTNRQIAAANNAFNAQQNDLAWQRELQMWNMTNDYNTPAAQVQRLRDAGLSPYLAYSNLGSSTASAMTPPSAARANGYSYQSPLSAAANSVRDIMSILTSAQSLRNLRAQEAKTRSETENNLLSASWYARMAQSRIGMMDASADLSRSNRALSEYRTIGQQISNALSGKFGASERELGIELLRNRVAASTLDKQLSEARINNLNSSTASNNMIYNIRDQLYKYQDQYGYRGTRDFVNRGLNLGQDIIKIIVSSLLK